MPYQTVFDIATAGYKNWDITVFGLVFVAIGVGLVAARKTFVARMPHQPGWGVFFPFIFLAFAVLWTLVAFLFTYGEYHSLTREVKAEKVQVAEGVVSQFKPMPEGGHAKESFCVEQTCFEYSDFVVSAGFNNATPQGGPIREGLPVRVTHVGRTIVKLEVAK